MFNSTKNSVSKQAHYDNLYNDGIQRQHRKFQLEQEENEKYKKLSNRFKATQTSQAAISN